jgi:hypothetical protein
MDAWEGPAGWRWWSAGAVGGAIAGVLFGAIMPAEEMMPMVAALYGFEGLVAGWIFHLLHSIAFGLLFAVIVLAGGLRTAVARSPFAAVPGAIYGVALWVVFASFVMPAWIGGVTEMAPPVPEWNWLSLVGHIAYGGTLGGLFPVLRLAGVTPVEQTTQ